MYPTGHFHLNFPSISKNSTYPLLWWLKLPSTQLPEPETSGSATIPFSLQCVYISHKVLSCLVPSNLSNVSTFLYLHITTFRKLLTNSHLVILWLSLPDPPLTFVVVTFLECESDHILVLPVLLPWAPCLLRPNLIFSTCLTRLCVIWAHLTSPA